MAKKISTTRKAKVPVAIYARSAVKSGGSIRRQRRACAKLAASIGAEVVATYVDDGSSGLARKRPGLDDMVRDARLGKFEGVIVEDQERLARSELLGIELIEQLAAANAPVRSVKRISPATAIRTSRARVGRARRPKQDIDRRDGQ